MDVLFSMFLPAPKCEPSAHHSSLCQRGHLVSKTNHELNARDGRQHIQQHPCVIARKGEMSADHKAASAAFNRGEATVEGCAHQRKRICGREGRIGCEPAWQAGRQKATIASSE
jgi:hypothetical protein